MQVAKILENKGSDVYTIAPNATIETAVAALRDHGIGALVVSSNGTTVEGIVSERDFVHCMADRGIGVLSTPVSDVMTADVLTCTAKDTSRDLLGQMTERRIRHVPVVENGALCGMISIGDAVKSRLDEVIHEAHALREYISQT
jgi:CBS domain-containing protein